MLADYLLKDLKKFLNSFQNFSWNVWIVILRAELNLITSLVLKSLQNDYIDRTSNPLPTSSHLSQLATFCNRWDVIELALFGSIVRDDLRPESDIDVLITLGSTHSWGLEIVTMREELSVLCKRSIDLLTRQSIENSRNALRCQEILESAEVIYVTRYGSSDR